MSLEGTAPGVDKPSFEGWRGSGAILAVEDDEFSRTLIRRILERYGFEVLEAADGREALAVFQGRPADIRAVLLDLTMPRLGGEETLRELRRIRPDVRVVLMSGHSEREVTSLLGGEIAGFVQKPFRMEQLLTILRRCLDR